MDNQTWIVVADAAYAKIYNTTKVKLITDNASEKDIHLVSTHEHMASRQKDIDLVTDKPGNFGKGAFNDASDPKQNEAEKFAHELAKVLNHAKSVHRYHELILVAPPAFMGLLKKSLPHEVDKAVCATIEKDYTKTKADELVKHLQNNL